jgi:uncharacterized protein
MPANLTFPGVYIEEIPSGVRTITGVATSITAFIGRALRGPTDQEPIETDRAVTINSFADFQRIYGGLWEGSTLGFAVRDFFLNGGSQAIIVRLYNKDTTANAKNPKTKLTMDDIVLEAAYEGTWGRDLRATVEPGTSDEVAKSLGLTDKGALFNLTVSDTSPGGSVEKFQNLSVKSSPRRIDKVLKAESSLVRWAGLNLDTATPPPPAIPTTPKFDTVTTAENTAAPQLPAAKKTLADAQDKLDAAQKKLDDLKSKDPNDPGIPAAQAAVDSATTERDNAKAAIAAINQKVQDAKDALDGNDGLDLKIDNFTGSTDKHGLSALDTVDLFNILCIPPYQLNTSGYDVDVDLVSTAAQYCETHRAMLLVDPRSDWVNEKKAHDDFLDVNIDRVGTRSKNAALFFPRLRQSNPLKDNQLDSFVPCGAVAGIFARTDTQRGVWKAPAGLDASLVGVQQLSVNLTDLENGDLNQLGINCLRTFPAAGHVVWGARTLQGADRLTSEWKYIPVRRTALYIEESLFRGTQWVVFEPNDEPLWAQIRLNVGAFMQNLFRQGAFQGKTPRDAYFVKCDKETTTQNDINNGIVNIVVGFAPLKPAEFVVIQLQQIAGQIQV